MTRLGTVIDGKYEVLKEIGRGGMSTVYLAMDKRLNKQWAVKEIRKKGTGRSDEIIVNSLLAEANLMKRLDHPALPRIVDIIDNGITIYVVMDYIEGESLDKILEANGPQPEEKVIGWAKQLCDVLGYLHSQKPPIIYRDMKPANVMLKPEGNVKIIDFGIAREYKEQSLADTTVLGTKGYAPPEQYSGQTDQRSDIYALGMTMHHLLTGVDPRGGERYVPVKQWDPYLSDGIEAIIDKCVQPAAENRYQSCSDLLYDLEHPDLITKGYKRKQKRRLGLVIASAVLTIVLLCSGFVCKSISDRINHDDYDNLVAAVDSTSYDEKIQSYKRAIEIFPYDTRAYMRMLEAYEEVGEFDEKRSSEISALYKKNYEGFDKTSVEYAELNYKLGTMYFNYYTEQGESKLSTRVNKADDYFIANYNNKELVAPFANQASSDCYYHICVFYKEFIFDSALVKEPTKDDYNKLLQDIEDTMQSAKDNGSDAYEKLSLYNAAMMVLNDQRDGMASLGVDRSRVQRILSLINDEAARLPVQKERSKQLQQEILEHYEEFSAAIDRAYQTGTEG